MARKHIPKAVQNMWSLREEQKQVFDFLLRDPDELLLIARRRLGKTRGTIFFMVFACYWASEVIKPYLLNLDNTEKLDSLIERWKLLGRDFSVGHIFPKLNTAKAIVQSEMPAITNYFATNYPGLPLFKEKVADNQWILEIPGDPFTYRYRYTGFDKMVEGQRGQGYEIMCIDEIQDYDDGNIKTVLNPMLQDAQGIKICIGTAKANKIVKDYKKEYRDEEGKRYLQFTLQDALDNGSVTQKEFDKIARDAGGVDSFVFRQEQMCEDDLPVDGAIFTYADFVSNPPTPPQEEGDTMRIAAMDIGYRDAYVVVIGLLYKDDEGLVKLDLEAGYKFTETLSRDIIEAIRKDFPNNIDVAYLPHDGMKTSPTTSDTEFSIWKASGIAKAVRKGAHYTSKEERVRKTVEKCWYVTRSTKFDESHSGVEILTDLQNWEFEKNKEGDYTDRPSKSKYTHSGDAITYLITSALTDKVSLSNMKKSKDAAPEKSYNQRFIDGEL